MSITALLPMKAHSSRVPGKNFKHMLGRPLFRWTLDNLLQLDSIDQVVINTDARKELYNCGLEDSDRVIIRDRPAELCGDDVSMNLVLQDDIEACGPGHYLMTHTTNPAISAKTFGDAVAAYHEAIKSGYDSLFSVNRFQTRFYGEGAVPINHDPENLIPTQDLTPWYEENSCIYLFSDESFNASNARIGRRPIMFETPKLESIDIDEFEDWLLAERLLTSKN